jgi:7-carboxy-7-deazaguanine synthase
MKISEIFTSIQGESTFAGLPCTFIRAAGCNLHCSYCDTLYAREGGSEWSLERILNRVREAGFALTELTGGEPLLQQESYLLMERLLEEGYAVLLETNGSVSLEQVDRRVIKIMDLKCPGSEMSSYMAFSNIAYLTQDDEVKFVIGNRSDFDWAREIIGEYRLLEKCTVLISPVFSQLKASTAAEWILQEQLPVRLQLQLHKVIWPEKNRGV